MAGKLADTDQKVYDAYMKDLSVHDPDSYKMLAGVDPSSAYGILKNEPDFNDVSKIVLGTSQPSFADKALDFAKQSWEATKNVAGVVTPNAIQDLASSTAKGLGGVADLLNKGAESLEDVGGQNPASDFLRATGESLPQSKAAVGLLAAGPAMEGLASAGGAMADNAMAMGKEFLNNPERGLLAQKINPFPSSNPDVSPEAANYLAKASKVQDQFGPLLQPTEAGTQLNNMVQGASRASAAKAQIPYDFLEGMAMQSNAKADLQPIMDKAEELGINMGQLPFLQEPKFARLGAQLSKIAEAKSSLAAIEGSDMSPEAKAEVTEKYGTAAQKTQISFLDGVRLRSKLASLASAQNGAYGSSMPGLAGQTSNQGRMLYDLADAAHEGLRSGAADHPELLSQLKEAGEGWKDHMNTFGNDQILGLAGKGPSQAGQYLFDTTEGINALRKAVGEPGLDVLRRGVAHSVIDPVASSNDPGKALDGLISDKQEQFDRLFRPSQTDALRDFAGAREKLLNQTQPEDKAGIFSKLAGYFKKKVPGKDEVNLASDLMKE